MKHILFPSQPGNLHLPQTSLPSIRFYMGSSNKKCNSSMVKEISVSFGEYMLTSA